LSALPGHVGCEPFLGAQRFVPERGFTLHEALVTLTIIGVVAVSAVGFTRILHSTQMTSQVNTLVADLSLARSEAIKRARIVTVCKSRSGDSCTAASAWHEGWIVFADDNDNAQRDDGETIIKIEQALAGGATLSFGAWGPGAGKYVSYRPMGTTRQNGTFTFCGLAGSAKAVILIQTGRIRVSNKKSSGTPPVCP
jgi:type IV fimbrial biogenesis protein FimT